MKKISGYILIILGIFLISFHFISTRKEVYQESSRIQDTLEKETNNLKQVKKDLYDAVLSIPVIHLKRGIYSKTDSRNNISQNVEIHEMSDYPDVEYSNVILMAHSGVGEQAYFNDLDKLNTDSLVEFYYHYKKYVYKIDHYYQIEKTGTAEIIRDKTKKTITLITCNQKDKSKQLIYIGYLIDEISYE